MKWALKFSTKGKGAGGGPDAGKPYQGSSGSNNNFRNGGAGGDNGARGGGGAGDGGAFRSSSDGEGPGGEYYDEDDGPEQGQERDTPIVTPPDAANGGRGRGAAGGGGGQGGGPDAHQRGEKYEASGDEHSSATYDEEAEHHNGSSAPHFTVDSEGRRQRGGEEEVEEGEEEEGEEMDYEDARHGQQGVFDEDGDSQADSLQASKTARMKSFADDPEAHELEDNAEWDGESLEIEPQPSLAGAPRDVASVTWSFAGICFASILDDRSRVSPCSLFKLKIPTVCVCLCVCVCVRGWAKKIRSVVRKPELFAAAVVALFLCALDSTTVT